MPFFIFDPTFVILIPALLLALWAQAKVRSTYSEWSEVRTAKGLTGAAAAEAILRTYGISVDIQRIPGALTDHYDPRTRVLRLSDAVYDSPSVAAVGVAAHECGHAIQHAEGYFPLAIRNAIVPVVSFGSHLAFPLFIVGLVFSVPALVKLGILLFAGVVAFHVITLPVEFDASRRAISILRQTGLLLPEEVEGAKEVLTAAAMTYVAAAAMAVLNLIRLLILARRR